MMARRIERVEKNLQRIIGQIIDEELNPPGLVSVMDVTCDSGLTQARVAVSIYTKTGAVERAFDYLGERVGFIRHELSIRAKMRRTPEITFILDTSLEDGQSMIDYIADLTDSRQQTASHPETEMKQGTTHSISGFLNIDKPSGWTSFDVVAKLRSAFQLRQRGLKIGHCGTLDPLATGVLPICIGGATRLSEFVLTGSKSYLMSAMLGISTDTYDSEGTETKRQDYSTVKSTDLISVMPEFRGEIDQIPPMYSAIKKNGQRLYKLARKGKTVALEPRKVEVQKLELTAWNPPHFTLNIDCGSGFYARSLANDVGQRLGCGAHMTSLRRTQAGDFHIIDSLSLDTLIECATDDLWTRHLLKLDHVLKQLPAVTLDEAETVAFSHGRVVERILANCETSKVRIRVYENNGDFIGLGRVEEEANFIHPATVFKDSIGN